MKTSIELNRIRFFSYHGVAEQERRVGNDYEVSLRVDYPLERAMESDSLCDTLDYAALYALVSAEMSVSFAVARTCRRPYMAGDFQTVSLCGRRTIAHCQAHTTDSRRDR